MQSGKVLVYDGATGKGKLMLETGDRPDFDVGSWESTDQVPEVGMSIQLHEDGTVSPAALSETVSQRVQDRSESEQNRATVGDGVRIGGGIFIVIAVLFVVLVMFGTCSQQRYR